MDTQRYSAEIAVVIATRNRTDLVKKRSLASVLAQTLSPKYLVFVDDSSLDFRIMNRELVEHLDRSGSTVKYLENSRTEGPGGCWNTAIDLFFAENENPDDLFIAILDDDDAWDSPYLETCYTSVTEKNLDFVAADFRRIELIGGSSILCEAPETLQSEDFLIGNPGIQGSNMFIRLNVLVEAGGFDEALRSATDRDLCIRIADIGTARYQRIPIPLVNHYAEPGRIRLSTPGSKAKLQGLTSFWQKYGGRMDCQQRLSFEERAAALFDWFRPAEPQFSETDGSYDVAHHCVFTYPKKKEPTTRYKLDRVVIAEQKVKKNFSLDRVRLLGSGTEGVVFTDEHRVYKCIDHWTIAMSRTQLDFLRSQVGRWNDVPGLYAIREMVEDGSDVILTYDYEKSVPYQGGHEEEIIAFLQGCSAAGIVCNNVHPKNLILSESGVKLIDYGSDIRRFSDLGFEHMARRAFLACRYASHPELQLQMRRILVDENLLEFAGYGRFRSRLNVTIRQLSNHRNLPMTVSPVQPRSPFSLYVGIITSDPSVIRPLLFDLVTLQNNSAVMKQIAVIVLDNGSQPEDLDQVAMDARHAGLQVAIVVEHQQRIDAASGIFGLFYRERPVGRVGIAQARTMIQRYIGTLLEADSDSFGWILDDDMRVDNRACDYVAWLPAFRAIGVDALIGAYEGSSPNPGLNGIRVHLVDLFHNLLWLRRLPPNAALPDRSSENAVLRARYPDYYYDLSRKHTAHLETPYWLEPQFVGETVVEAYSRLLEGAFGILNGDPLTRPIVTDVPSDPRQSARNTVNRGGNTFILNSRALTQTPNMILRIRGREARRSDMVWAIVNRNYRRLLIKSVPFPVRHIGRVTVSPRFDPEKIQDEIIGSALYAGMTEFLEEKPHHRLDFSAEELRQVRLLFEYHLDRRLRSLDLNFRRINGICGAIRRVATSGEFADLIGCLDQWITYENYQLICAGARAASGEEIESFLASLRASADDYDCASVKVGNVAKIFDTGGVRESGT